MTRRLRLSATLLAVLAASGWSADPAERTYYQPPAWQPRVLLPTAEALAGFWPASPKVQVDYSAPGFDAAAVPQVPAPGIYPRVLTTPDEIARLRARVAQGDQAPAAFRVQWERIKASKSAFYALVAQDDDLGKSLAADLAAKVASLEPKLAKMEAQPDRDSLWALEKSTAANADPNPPSEIWSLLDYDYLHGWMTPEQREATRRVIARLTKDRISNYLMVPDHFMINNHQSFGMEYARLLLLLEGQEGYDQRLVDLSIHKLKAKLDWYLNKDGMCYESIKGWLNTSVIMALGMRDPSLLKHGHLRAKMNFFRAALRWDGKAWQIRDEMRASAFHVIWMMHRLYPQDRVLDLLHQATFTSHDFLVDAKAKWPSPVGVTAEHLLAWADDPALGADGKPVDWTDQKNLDSLNLPATWTDEARGYLIARNSWRKDDLQVGFTNKQDFFYGGHEGSEANRLTLSAHGVNWVQDLNMLATKQTYLQNMVTVDGKGLKWPPVPGVWLGTQESAIGVTAAGDAKLAYSFAKRMQVHPLDFPSGKTGYYRSFTEGNFDLTRDLQVAFHPLTVAWNDGFAHTDYGPWSGETRLVEQYQPWNPLEQAYRTVHLAKGERPYVLVLDDLRKDDQPHLFEWNITLPPDSDLVDTDAVETVFQAVEPTARRESNFLIGSGAVARDPATGRMVPKKGDPLLLVRVLWRNSPYGFPAPRFDRFRGHNSNDVMGKAGFAHLTIPAHSVSPEFRVLLYPHRHGDPLPTTAWNDDRTELNVSLPGQADRYRFAQADGGRTVFRMERGDQALASAVTPPRPVIVLGRERIDPNDGRQTRDDGVTPVHRFAGQTQVAFERPAPPAVLRWTADGSDPTATSPVYEGPLTIDRSATLTVRRFDPAWTAGPQVSLPTRLDLRRDELLVGQATPPTGSQAGLWTRVYELDTNPWDNRGFFRADQVMLPRLDDLTPTAQVITNGVQVPHAAPTRPLAEQAKGFYRWTGWFHAAQAGSYVFAIDSCGPVTLDVGPRGVIDHRGHFHQQQAVRRGTVLLGAGWHPVDLVVTDPQFWNAMTMGLMPVGLTVAVDGGPAEVPPASAWTCRPTGTLDQEPAVPQRAGRTDLPAMEPGLTMATYLRDVAMTDPSFLDIDGLTPRRVEAVNDLVGNARPGLVRVYDGWFHVTQPGVHTFVLPQRRDGHAGLNELRAAYQHQLRIDGEVVVQHGIPGRLPLGRIHLGEGWHHLSLRLGSSPADLAVVWPDGTRSDLGPTWWSRPRTVAIRPQGHPVQRAGYEIFGPTAIDLRLEDQPGAVIRLTTDGSEPTPASPAAPAQVTIDRSTVLTATAFIGDRAVTAPQRVTFVRNALPEDGLMAAVDQRLWSRLPAEAGGVYDLPGGQQAIIPAGSSLVEGVLRLAHAESVGKPMVDINLAKGGPKGLRINGLDMPDLALSVALRVKTEGDSGRLFGREGINAYGKGIRTLGLRLDKGRLVAEPGRLRGEAVAPGWHTVVMSVDTRQLVVWLDGKEVIRGNGTNNLLTDSLDLLAENRGLVGWARVYDRVLEPAEVAALSSAP